MHESKDHKDFNHLKEWLGGLLEQANLSVEELWNLSGISKASIYFWMDDRTRPSEQNIHRICEVLSQYVDRPITELFEEGLAQYVPKKNGRPKGSTGPRELANRNVR